MNHDEDELDTSPGLDSDLEEDIFEDNDPLSDDCLSDEEEENIFEDFNFSDDE